MCDKCTRLMRELSEAKGEISFLRMELEHYTPFEYNDENGSVFVVDDRPISVSIDDEIKKQNDELYNENQKLRKQLKAFSYTKYKDENKILRSVNNDLKKENEILREGLKRFNNGIDLAVENNSLRKQSKNRINVNEYTKMYQSKERWEKRYYKELNKYEKYYKLNKKLIEEKESLIKENKNLKIAVRKYEMYYVPEDG